MEELNVVKYLINRVELNVNVLNEYNKKKKEVNRLVKADELEGNKHTYWDRHRELGCNDPCCKSDIKDTLKLIRKITIELEKKL